MKKIVLFLVIIFLFNNSLVLAENNQRIIKWGNSSYHDTLGVRDPYVVKNQGTYYLYYDCIEDLLNPSFESYLGTNGWDTWGATAVATSEKKLFGNQSLKVTNTGVEGGGAYTGNYYFGDKTEANLAMPSGLEVTPNTTYIASAYVWAGQYSVPRFILNQYKDDPFFYSQNLILPTMETKVNGNNGWQRIYIKFTTSSTTTAVTISLISDINKISYWDGVQLEKVENNQSNPSDFPADIWFNYTLNDVIGWKTCLATSSDGINFAKQGMLYVGGARGGWENMEKPGWVGTSGNYMSPFYYGGYWYSYLWTAGYELGVDFNTKDPGELNHRKWYGDRRAFLPNGIARSNLVRSTSLTGPWERVSQSGPQITPKSAGNWGQVYVTANGVPQLINNQWVLFLAGAPGSALNWRTITPGLATGPTPLGPWTVTDYTPILPSDIPNVVPEGPIYYKDDSGTHFMFINDIAAGSVDAYWTNNPLNKWIPANKKTIVNNIDGTKGLVTVVEKDSNNLLVYFANRPYSGASNNWKNYLFHDINLTTLSLPLVAIPTNTPVPPTPTTVPCTDSDGGRIYTAKGNTCKGSVCSTDGCNSVGLVEYYCSNNQVAGENYLCGVGKKCAEGKCVVVAPTNTPVPPTLTPIPTNTPIPPAAMVGDYDGNRVVNLGDFGVWKKRYLTTPPTATLADFGVWKKAYLNN